MILGGPLQFTAPEGFQPFTVHMHPSIALSRGNLLDDLLTVLQTRIHGYAADRRPRPAPTLPYRRQGYACGVAGRESQRRVQTKSDVKTASFGGA